MPHKRILVLGGTGLAREAADVLVDRGFDTVTSLAGVTRKPHLPKGEIRIGGFDGVEGLVAYLQREKFDHMIDATHPFAAQMSAHAVAACDKTKTPLLRLEQAVWQAQKGDQWQDVATVDAAAEALLRNAKVIVTVGRKEIGVFFARPDLSGIARMIEPPETAAPPQWQVLLERPPFTLETEIDLLRASQAEILVSKNAGGPRATKLDAAATLGLPVIMVARPSKPAAPIVASLRELLGTLGLAG